MYATTNLASTPEANDAAGVTLDAIFRRSIQIFGDRIAVTSAEIGEASLTYRELGERADRLASGLSTLNLMRGDRLAILAETRPEYIELYVACARLGVTVVALNVRMHVSELAHCIKLSKPSTVLVSGVYGEQARALQTECASVKFWLSFDRLDGFGNYADLMVTDAPLPKAIAEPSDIHNILFTSGTTGAPKGAMISQSAAAVRAMRIAQWFRLTESDGCIGWMPLYHCGGDEPLYATLLTGGTFSTLRKAAPEAMFRVVERDRLTWTLLLPGLITAFMQDPSRRRFDLSSLRFAVGYANMMPNVVQRVTAEFNIDFYDAFGQTETSLLVANNCSRPGDVPSLRKIPTPLMEVRLVDSEMQEVPDGEPGECVVRGPTVMSGYLDNPKANREVFRGGWLHTGDVLVRHRDGTLSFVDRSKYLIKTGGENVYPAEVEQVVAAHPAVQEVCVFGIPDAEWGEAVKAIVCLVPGRSATSAEILEWCRQSLGGYKCPRYIEFLDENLLPRSATGKLQRHKLAERETGPEQQVR